MFAEIKARTKERLGAIEWIDSRTVLIHGEIEGSRIPSRILEQLVQEAVSDGARRIHIKACGQHGIGGRIWPRGEKVEIVVEGPVGQRLGGMGMFGTEILVKGPASNDVGWLNCGASITVLGDVGDGAFNAAAQGILYVKGSGGARCDTLTKYNPRFEPPQSWYLRDVGDSFAEFKAGGTSVVCGYNPRNKDNVLGYRPCVGMVGGVIYFRGNIQEFSEKDVKLLELEESDWLWLKENMRSFLRAIGEEGLYNLLTASPYEWKKLVALTPEERRRLKKISVSISEFRKKTWEKEVGEGGIFAEYIDHERWDVVPYIVTGELRRQKPVWANEAYLSPCSFACPTQIPVNRILATVRSGDVKKAANMLLENSPLPATVCGALCPNLCMDACARCDLDSPVRISKIGELSLLAQPPELLVRSDKRVAVIGGGPAGMSISWHLTSRGYTVDLYEAETELGGKIEILIPREKFSYETFLYELKRFKDFVKNVHLGRRITKDDFTQIYRDHDAVVIACGAHMPRILNFPGSEHAISAYEFLKGLIKGKRPDLKGKSVVIIGAGNVGIDVASQAHLLGAENIYAIDIQRPSAFLKELELAKRKGIRILWPKKIKAYDRDKRYVHLEDGLTLKADYIFLAIGEIPALEFLPDDLLNSQGFVEVNEFCRTRDSKVFAIGDVTGLGLITHAIGHGKRLAHYIHEMFSGFPPKIDSRISIDYERVKKEYYYGNPRPSKDTLDGEAERCFSCAMCRDCRVCESACYYGAIKRLEAKDGSYIYVVEDDKCIGCGFCAYVCPCGIWEMARL